MGSVPTDEGKTGHRCSSRGFGTHFAYRRCTDEAFDTAEVHGGHRLPLKTY